MAIIKVGLIGSGIGRSASPSIHMLEASALGLELRYDIFDTDNEEGGASGLGLLLDRAQSDGYAGVNVTHPCKQQVIPLLHEVSPDASALGAVNTVVFQGGRRIGHNTDWHGFSEGFSQALAGAAIGKVTQLGAGGAGAAVAYAMLKRGAGRLHIYDPETERALGLAGRLAGLFGAHRVAAISDLSSVLGVSDGLINASPVGMHKYPGMPVAAALLRSSLWVAEVVYVPLQTELLRVARALGCRTADGGGMVVYQALEAFRLFTGAKPDASRMLERFRATHPS